MDFACELGLNTRLAHVGEEHKVLGAVAPPIFHSSLFVFETFEEFAGAIYERPNGPPHHYSRISNPSVDLAEQKIASLEGTEGCKLCSTGQGAITLGIMVPLITPMSLLAAASPALTIGPLFPPFITPI